MAKVFEEWTVCPHDPIVEHGDNLWTVDGKLKVGAAPAIPRRMTVAKLGDGRLVIYNGIALDEPEMKRIEAWGKPSFLIVPNGFHRQDAKIFKQRYPEITVIAPKGHIKRVEQVLKVDADCDALPTDPNVKLTHFPGTKDTEPTFEVKTGDKVTVVLNDMLGNLPKLGGVPGFILSPTGRPSIPRAIRWFLMKDKKKVRAELDRIAGIPGLARVVVSHGAIMESGLPEMLRGVGAEFAG
jgi:hypothetical protein